MNNDLSRQAHDCQPFYSHGRITAYLGDCLDILPQLGANSFDFVLTDPPYLVNYTGRWNGERKVIVGDDDASWLYPAFAEIWRVLKEDTFFFCFYGWPHAELFVGVWKDIGFRLISHIAFVKNVWGLGRFSRGQHETAYLLAKGRPALHGKPISDVIEWTRETTPVHPNQKPVGALYPLLNCYAPRNGIVLDPFMGSGSTLRAAKDLGMAATGIEIEPGYCDLARRRLAQEVLLFSDD